MLRFALSFVLITLPLTWFWLQSGAFEYAAFLRQVGDVVYGLFGVEGVWIGARARHMNLIAFVALVLSTPRLGLARRTIGLLVGFVILVLTHVAFSYVLYRTGRLSYGPVLVNVSDALPLALWVVIAPSFVWESMKQAGSRVGLRSPDQKAEQSENPDEA